MFNSVIEKFAKESSKVRIGKVNADVNKEILSRYNARGLPQFVLIKEGKEIKRTSGAMTLTDLKAFCKVEN